MIDEKNLGSDLSSALSCITKKWKAEKRKADKNDHLRPSQYQRFQYSDRITIKEVAAEVMEAAYNKASSNGKYYANARQIYYAARPMILARTTKSDFESSYFTQTLLKDYLEDRNPDWKVVWDARGHFSEPHTGKVIGVGGADVEEYLNSWSESLEEYPIKMPERIIETRGAINRFGSVLFIEKEGFNEILEDMKIGERYDMAIVSTKGIPVKALCDLLTALQNKARIFVLHDFDKSGFTILKTLEEGTRMAQGCEFIDLGFRLEDVKGLQTEKVYGRGGYPKSYLEECGASKDEINFLIEHEHYRDWEGKRVELNAMTTEELIGWLEGKLKHHGVKKVIPGVEMLASAYRHAALAKKYEHLIEDELKEIDDYPVPKNIEKIIRARLKKNPEESWDSAVWNIAEENKEEET